MRTIRNPIVVGKYHRRCKIMRASNHRMQLIQGTVANMPSVAVWIFAIGLVPAQLAWALRVGPAWADDRFGKADGFDGDPNVRIPLPDNLPQVRSVLGLIGQSALVDDVELKLNHVAEAATPEPQHIFW